MTIKIFKVKTKIVNHIMVNGKKETSEKLLLQSVKKLCVLSSKQIKKLVLLSLVNATPVFKLHQSINKKIKKKNRKIHVTPTFIPTTIKRTSSSIKFILTTINKKKLNNFFFTTFTQEILLLVENKGITMDTKKETQKKVLLNKRYFKYYRW